MDVHRLDSHASWSGEPIPYQLSGTGEHSGGKPLELGLHLYRSVFVYPATGLYINRLTRTQHDFKDIPISVQPNDTLTSGAVKFVDKKSGPA